MSGPKPLLQLFYESKSQQMMERVLQNLLDEKNDRKANSLERDILEVIVTLFGEHPDGVIPFNDIRFHLTEKNKRPR